MWRRPLDFNCITAKCKEIGIVELKISDVLSASQSVHAEQTA